MSIVTAPGEITLYQLDVFDASTSESVLRATPNTNSYLASGLVCCNTYSFRVAAATSAGFGPVASGPILRTLADLTSKLIHLLIDVHVDHPITTKVLPLIILLATVF